MGWNEQPSDMKIPLEGLLQLQYLRSTSGERNHNLAQAEKISISWLIQIDAILDFSERVWERV